MRYLKTFEELNISGTYFTKASDMKKNIEVELINQINSISQKLNIKLPIEAWSEDFIKIKTELSKQITNSKTIQNYFYEWGQDKKFIEQILLKHCSNQISAPKTSSSKKLNITHLDFKLVDHVDHTETYQVIFPPDIKNHIINNFSTNKLDYLIYINCESDNFNRLHFPGRIERWFRSHDKRFGKDELPEPYKGKHGEWISDLFDGIPESLRGTGLGYAIYKEFLKFKGYLSSGSWSSSLSQSVWKKLTSDPDIFGVLVNYKGQDGNILLFSKDFKGDYKKICKDFIEKAKAGKLYRGNPQNFEIKDIEIDDELKKIVGDIL